MLSDDTKIHPEDKDPSKIEEILEKGSTTNKGWQERDFTPDSPPFRQR